MSWLRGKTVEMTNARRASDEGWCERSPEEGHSWSYTHHAGLPRVETRTCMLCRFVSVQPVQAKLAELIEERDDYRDGQYRALRDRERLEAEMDRRALPREEPPTMADARFDYQKPLYPSGKILTEDLLSVGARMMTGESLSLGQQVDKLAAERSSLANDVARLVHENERLRGLNKQVRQRIEEYGEEVDRLRREAVTYSEQTLFKVRHTLVEAGFSDSQAMLVINELGGAGILFRERIRDRLVD